MFHTNSPSGQPFEFSAAKHRARMKAEFTAQCNASAAPGPTAGPRNLELVEGSFTIVDAYAEAMKAKRLRECQCKCSDTQTTRTSCAPANGR